MPKARSGGKATQPIEPKQLCLALQGGGSHGAFTWGVLDRLLEDERIEIEGISGTSAGAMNAVVMADGLVRNGRAAARESLNRFWTEVGRIGRFGPIARGPFEQATGNWNLDASPSYMWLDLVSRFFSPYQFNPLNFNPLQDALEKMVDFDRVRRCDKVKLFIAATNVRSGKIRIFNNADLSSQAVMASACLPHLFQSVEIDGEAYWDGGYMGNPALYPLIYNCRSRDVAIVQINPLLREDVPRTPTDILDRLNEISFNSSLMREMRAVEFVSRLIEEHRLDETRYKRMLIHRIEAVEEMRDLGASTKLNAETAFLNHLFEIGRDAASRWLTKHFSDLGRRSSIDIVTDYL